MSFYDLHGRTFLVRPLPMLFFSLSSPSRLLSGGIWKKYRGIVQTPQTIPRPYSTIFLFVGGKRHVRPLCLRERLKAPGNNWGGKASDFTPMRRG